MKPAILLVGSGGQVGRDLSELLPQVGEVVALDRQRLDLSQPDEIRGAIRASRPAWIVNAAAYTAVDKAESEEPLARAINAEAPRVMAEEAKKIGASLVHYSTDYVFDGAKAAPYEEDDPTNPQNAYGRTKLEGELAIRESGAAHLIFRTAWVYAPRGRNFLLTILRLATQREELKVVRDQIGAPTLSREIARATTEILENLSIRGSNQASLSGASGTYHMTAGGETSWYDFAAAILEKSKTAPQDLLWLAAATGGLPVIARRILPIPTAEYPTPARRPPYSVLSNARLNRGFSVKLPDWNTQLDSIFATSFEKHE
jgi:dTDP-4-dehydrorhamnose reductase